MQDLSESQIFVNMKDPSQVFIMAKAKPTQKVKFPQKFITSFYPIFAYLMYYPEHCKLLCYIITQMDKHNILEESVRNIANHVREHETNVSKKLKELVDKGIIIRKGKKIMLSPAAAMKNKSGMYYSLAKSWNEQSFVVDDKDMTEENEIEFSELLKLAKSARLTLEQMKQLEAECQ